MLATNFSAIESHNPPGFSLELEPDLSKIHATCLACGETIVEAVSDGLIGLLYKHRGSCLGVTLAR